MKFVVYSKRWGHDDHYKIEKTEKGWHIGHLAIKGDCDKTGKPFLFRNFEQDCIHYPSDIGYYLEMIWEKAESEDRNEKWIQEQLDLLSEWVKIVEKSTPEMDLD